MMSRAAAPIRRPAALVALLCGLAAACAWSAAAFVQLRANLDRSPTTLVYARAGLAEALREAPFTGEAGRGEPVYVIGAVGCGGCAEDTRATVQRLRGAALEVRLLLVADGAAADDPAAGTLAAAVARTGDATLLDMWPAVQEEAARALSGPEEVEGYLEWSRQSAARVGAAMRANGVEPAFPIVVWRRGADWRVATGEGARAAERARRDLAIAAGS